MRITEGVDVDPSLNVPFGSAIFLFYSFFNHVVGREGQDQNGVWNIEKMVGFLTAVQASPRKVCICEKAFCVIHYPDRSDFETGGVGNPKLRTCICYFLYFVGHHKRPRTCCTDFNTQL